LGTSAYVIEEGLSGRTTAFEDPFSAKKNGLEYLPVSLQTHSPLDLCIVMLGTNDLKTVFNLDPFAIGQGCFRLLETIKQSGAASQILLVCPALVVETEDVYIKASFKDSVSRSLRLPAIYKRVAEQLGCHFLNAGDFCSSSIVDGIHLDREAHDLLGNAIADRCAAILRF
jgi:lysophospholipase L1-like esterase